MKKTMKKITASLLALLILIQIVPAMAAVYSSGVIVGTSKGFKEKLEIVASKGTYVLLGQTLVLDVNEDYVPVWKSADETIATIDKTGMVTALQAGIVEITATQGEQSYTVEVTIIDPEPILQEAAKEAEQEAVAEEPTEEPKEEPTEEPVEEPTEEPIEEPVEEPTEEPVEEPVEEPTEEPVEEPVEEPTEEPVEEPTEEPVEEPTEEPVEEPTEEPIEEPVEEPTEEPVEEPVEEPTEEPVEEPVEEPTEEPVEEPTEEPVEEPTEEPIEEPTEEPVEEPTEEPVEEPVEEPTEEPVEEPVEQPEEKPVEKPVQKIAMVVVINAESQRVVYDGEEHLMDGFEATSNEDSFDPSKIKVSGDLGVRGTDCGLYELKLEDIVFTYDDPNVIAHFVVNNGWMKITPAYVTVTANEVFKNEGEADPELTATVVGLYGEDTIEYTLSREPGERVGEYVINVTGEEQQGNYRINYVAGKFEIAGKPTVTIKDSILDGQTIYYYMERTLKAVATGFGDAELTYQWQYSTDGENWTDIEGATKKIYSYIIDETNANNIYRVLVTSEE